MPEIDSEYFPPLDRCLSERTLLISWKAAFIGLSIPRSDQRRDAALERFLSDKHTTQLLVRPFNAFPAPNAQSKSAFETGTAAIHVTPSNKWNGDLDQLKADALWLSKTVRVDEVSALRIAVIEWQSRPAEQLRCGLSGEELLGAQAAVTPNASRSVMLGPSSPTAAGFHDEAGRRTRLVKLYLSERRHHSKVLEILVRAGLSDANPADLKAKGKATSTTWADAVGKTILNARCSGDDSAAGTENFLLECIGFLQNHAQNLFPGNGAFTGDDDFLVELETERRTCVMLEMIHVMQLIFCLVDSSQEVLSSATVLAWLRFAGGNRFFDGTELAEELSMSLPLPGTLRLLVEHAELKNASVPKRPYITDTANISEIHSLLMDATEGDRPVASLAVFAWGIILQSLREEVSSRKEARQSHHDFGDSDMSAEEPGRPAPPTEARSTFDQVSRIILGTPEDVVQHLAKSAVDGSQVFNVIFSLSTEYCKQIGSVRHGDSIRRMQAVLLELIRVSLEWVQYSPEVLAAALGVVSGGDSTWSEAAPSYGVDPVSMFLADDVQLVPKILEIAEARFPYEVLPFLKLISALATCPQLGHDNLPMVVSRFLTPQTFTQLLPPDFADYDTTREEENQNFIVLRSPLNIFTPRTRLISGQPESLAITDGQIGLCDGLVIQPDTQGQVINEQAPVVVQWMYPYSGLRYLGRLLDATLPNGYFEDDIEHVDHMRDIVAEIIGLLAVFLESIVNAPALNEEERMEAAQRLLSDASDGLGRNGDIITIVLDHFEAGIQQPGDPAEMAAGSMDTLISCTRFLRALIPILPGRVWPFFVRSGLLDMDGTGGRLSDLIGSTEIVTGRYEFLLGCIRIFDGLVDEAVDHAVARRCLGSAAKSTMRDSCGTGISEHVMTKVVLAFTRTLVDVFRSYHNWKFLVLEERLEMGTRILTIFNKILIYTHSIEDTPDSTLLGMLVPAAKYLVDVFLLPTSSALPVVSLMQMFVAGVDTPQSTLFFSTTWAWGEQMVKSLDFCNTLLRVNTLLKQKRSHLEERLFGALPLLVRLYTAFQSYTLPVVTLLEAMVLSAATAEGEPPSLLGHLGASSARDFIILLTRGSKPFDDEELDVPIWRLMSAVVSSRQSWFTIYLLTGKAPRNTLQPGDQQVRNGKKMVVEALDQLADMSIIPRERSLAMLEFVLFAIDYWPWAAADVRGHDKFFNSVLEYLGSMDTRVDRPGRSDDSSTAVRMAALIAEIVAIHLHQSHQLGDTSLVQKLLPKISYLVDHGVDVRGYNESLHANLKRNFGERFPGCNLSMFRRTKLQPVELGPRYFYNIDLAERMLQYDRSWKGAKGPGLAEDVARANVNMSLVEAQVLLLSSWRILVLELCRNLSSPSLQSSIAKVVKGCLEANKDQNVPEDIFTNLTRVRSDLAFVLMQRLAEARSTVPEVKTVIFTVWDTIQQSDINFELALAGGDVGYYRPLLKILFLSLRPLLDHDTKFRASQLNKSQSGNPPFMELQPVILNLLDLIVARGFRHLTVAVHDNPTQSSPEDIALVTAILQTTLRIPGVQDTLHQQICNRFAEHETARVATTLFSWADQLVIDGDPIYGELAILFLVELSCVEKMAEQLAVEGVLSQLSNANLTSIIRRGVRPLDRPPRLYTIWTRGFLPLCLNLLQAVGAAICPEVSTFLSQFDAQLLLASNSFDNQPLPSAGRVVEGKDFFTLSQAAEVHSLCMIWRIIEFFRQMGASTGYLATEILSLPASWDPRGLKEDIEYWLARRGALRERLLPLGPVEEEETRTKPIGKGGVSGCDDRFEERFIGELMAVVRLLSADTTANGGSRSTI
ncbi:MAG: hypothetical protein M1823_001249 [Watsoniomyces obsoletus]|nr:MAG: hypothetical protein M1823_001249 [Watsoniomyces obsoletus]